MHIFIIRISFFSKSDNFLANMVSTAQPDIFHSDQYCRCLYVIVHDLIVRLLVYDSEGKGILPFQ